AGFRARRPSHCPDDRQPTRHGPPAVEGAWQPSGIRREAGTDRPRLPVDGRPSELHLHALPRWRTAIVRRARRMGRIERRVLRELRPRCTDEPRGRPLGPGSRDCRRDAGIRAPQGRRPFADRSRECDYEAARARFLPDWIGRGPAGRRWPPVLPRVPRFRGGLEMARRGAGIDGRLCDVPPRRRHPRGAAGPHRRLALPHDLTGRSGAGSEVLHRRDETGRDRPGLAPTNRARTLGRPATGTVLDAATGGANERLDGRIFAFPHGKGSTVGSYVIYGLAKRGVGPAGIVNFAAEGIVAVGAILAGIPMVDHIDVGRLENGDTVRIDGDRGTVEPPGVRARPVVSVVLRNGGRILLVRRSPSVGTFRGRWSVISGSIEGREDPKSRAIREVREETGLRGIRFRANAAPIHARDGATMFVVHPFLFDAPSRRVRLAWENVEHRWIRPE